MYKNLNKFAKFKKVLMVCYLLFVVLVSGGISPQNNHFVLAQDQTQNDPPDQIQNDPGNSSTNNNTNPNSGGFNLQFEIPNPIKVDTFEGFIKNLLGVILTIGIPIVVIFIIYSGFLFVIAAGNEEKLQTAKKNLLYVVIGSAILLGAWVLAQVIGDTVNCIGGDTTNC